jgi:hypothetical protein
MALPPAQEAAVLRAIARATTSSTIGITQEADGGVVVRISRAGRVGFQVIESVVTPDGMKTVVQLAYDSVGRLVHHDPKTR